MSAITNIYNVAIYWSRIVPRISFLTKKALEDELFESLLSFTPVLVLELLGFLLFEEFLVLVIELIDATGAVNEFHLTGVERV